VTAITIDAGNGDDALHILSALPFIPHFIPGPGDNSLIIAAGNYLLPADADGLHISLSGSDAANPTTLAFDASQHLASLSLSGNARASLTPGPGKVLRTNDLTIAADAVLDLGKSDLILQATHDTRDAAFARIFAWIRSARADYLHLWQRPGLTTTEGGILTGLASTLNDAGDSTFYEHFSGQLVDRNCILVKYTWSGDTNLDGVVNADDYFLIDGGFISQDPGYRNGDLNYDGVVNADDYFLVDIAFIGQSAPLSASAPAPASAPPDPTLASPNSPGLPYSRSSLFDQPAHDLFSNVPVPALP
jgi:hypothetical protein